MEEEITIKLKNDDKREILAIFTNGIEEQKSELEIRSIINRKLEECWPGHTESDLQLVIHDCEMYILTKNIYSRRKY